MSYASRAKESKFEWDQRGNLKVENACIFWTNFKGEPTKFNPAGGKRTFNLGLPEKVALELRELGWNVKERPGNEDDDDILYYTEIVVNMKSRYLPRVYLCSEFRGHKAMNRLYEDTIGELDDIRFENVDITINPHEHGVGQYTFKGYANELIVTQAETELFGGKYADYQVSERHSGDYEEEESDDTLPF